MKESAKQLESWRRVRAQIVGVKMQLEGNGIRIHIPLRDMSKWSLSKISEYYNTLLHKYRDKL